MLETGHALPRAGRAEHELQAHGGALLPGLTDHHLHLFATAADLASAACDPATVHDAQGLTRALHRAGPDRHGWVRGVRYHESVAGELDASRLDALRGDVPVRVQHRSGALWMLNSRAVAAVGLATADHAGVERDADGRPTGRLWRADAWLRDRLPPGAPPSLADLGRRLAGYGITTVTDATPGLDAATVAAVSEAMARAELPQRVHLLGAPLTGSPPGRSGPQAGPWKIVIADSALPGYDELAEAVEAAHRTGRPVAVHCATREAILLLLAVPGGSGYAPRRPAGTRVPDSLRSAAGHTAPGPASGDPAGLPRRPRRRLPPRTPADEHGDLYRCASLRAAGIPVGLSSDSPYGPIDPWAVMRAAVQRRTGSGTVLGPGERLTPAQALEGYLSTARRPGDSPRRIHPGTPADLVLLRAPMPQALLLLDAELVRLVLIGGRPVAGDDTGPAQDA